MEYAALNRWIQGALAWTPAFDGAIYNKPHLSNQREDIMDHLYASDMGRSSGYALVRICIRVRTR